MAGKSTISITFKLDGDAKSFKDLAKDAEGLKKVITSTVSEAQQLNSRAINFAALATGLDAVQRSVSQLQAGMKDLADAYAVQEVAETKLATVMQQRMGATDAEIQSIKDLASAQQELGVIGDEVQLSGAQQIATFLNEKASLETLLPAMNNLLAQQKGLNATTQDAVTVGNLMGKVMQGQTSALTRVGITFDEAEEKVLKYGTEQERAAMLAQVITNNVGEMNAQLAQTESGKQQQLVNTLGDMKEQLGGLVNGALPFITIAAHSATALTGVTTLVMGVKNGVVALKAFNLKGKATASITLLMGVNAKKSAAVMRIFSSAMKTGAHSATALKLALRGLLISTGIGVAIAAVTTAIEAFSNAADEAAEKEKQLADEFRQFKKEIRDLGQTTGENAQKEIAALDKLFNVAKDETQSKEKRTAAIKELQNQYPTYFNSLSAEAINVKQLTTDYDNLRNAILETARARAAESRIEQNTGLLIDVEQQIKAKQAEVEALQKSYNAAIDAKNKAEAKHRAPVSAAALGDFREMKSQDVQQHVKSLTDAGEAVGEAKRALAGANSELSALLKKQAELNAANTELAAIIEGVQIPTLTTNTATTTGGAGADNTPLWKEDAATLREITDNIQILQNKLQTASVAEAALINQQIAGWQAKADAIRNAGKTAEDNTPLWKEDAATLREITDNIQILQNKLQTATADEAALINQQIELWNAKADAIRNAGKTAEDNTPLWKEDAATLQDIGDNIEILTVKLQTATVEEAALINQQIRAWNDKADAIRNAGKEAEKTAVSTGKALRDGWGGIKNIGSSIEGITESLKGNGSAWQIVVGIVDGFIGLYEGIQTVIGIIELLTAASAAHAVTKGVEAGAETTAATVRTTTAATNTAAGVATIASNKLVAASYKELAAAEYMAAHAYIPFAGFGIAMGFTTAMLAAVTAAGIPMLAEGGIASGPTLAMVGEYAGASGNPEVIAPLDKLRGMLAGPTTLDFGNVKFEIEGRKLVAILAKENEHKKRG